jgi:hypothetical protein
MFTVPFTKSGKSHSSNLREQQKRKSIVFVENGFPWLTTRQKIVKVEETILSPCLSAAENVQTQVDKISEIVENSAEGGIPDKTLLTSLLQGSIMPRTSC